MTMQELAFPHYRLPHVEEGVEVPTRVQLLKDGDLGWLGSDLSLDEAGAERIIAHFQEHGAEVPIDYHHSTLKVEKRQSNAKASAAGWIKGLVYVPGEGLYADPVEWTDTAAAEIIAKEYKYQSPVVLFEQDSGDLLYLHSVALTNRPRTKDAKQLLEAAEVFLAGYHKETNMPPPKKTKAADQPKPAGKPAAAQDEPVEEPPEFPAVDESQKLLMKLIEALQAKGVNIADDAPQSEVLQMAIETLGEVEVETPPEPAPAPAEGPPATPAAQPSAAELAALRAKAASADALNTRLAAVEGEIQSGKVGAFIDGLFEAGKLLPDDANMVAAAREFAEKDFDACQKFYGAMQPICPSGRATATTATPAGKNTERAKLIAAAMEEVEAHPDAIGSSVESYVDVSLGQAGEAPMSKAEREALNK